jgi:hypothetical protein
MDRMAVPQPTSKMICIYARKQVRFVDLCGVRVLVNVRKREEQRRGCKQQAKAMAADSGEGKAEVNLGRYLVLKQMSILQNGHLVRFGPHTIF